MHDRRRSERAARLGASLFCPRDDEPPPPLEPRRNHRAQRRSRRRNLTTSRSTPRRVCSGLAGAAGRLGGHVHGLERVACAGCTAPTLRNGGRSPGNRAAEQARDALVRDHVAERRVPRVRFRLTAGTETRRVPIDDRIALIGETVAGSAVDSAADDRLDHLMSVMPETRFVGVRQPMT